MNARCTILSVVLLAGCGGDGADSIPPTVPVRELPQPALRMIAPTAIRVGEEITIFGKGFADAGVGQTRLTFEGVFQASSGKTNQVQLDVTPTYDNQGLLTWSFGPNIPFTAEEDTGIFRGMLKAQNIGFGGEVKQAPQAIGVEIQVLPSILIRQMRPLNAGCPVGITATTDETPFLFEVKAIGLKSGSQNAPLRFVYTFLKENFQFSGYLSNQAGMDPEALFPQQGPVSVVDDVYNGTISTLGSGAPKNVYVFKGGVTGSIASLVPGADKLFGLTQLTTAAVPTVQGNYAADKYQASMNIVAMDSAGQETRRTIRLDVYSSVEVKPTGQAVPTRSYDPVPVTGCIPGGTIGRDVTYSEMTSETRSRSFTVHSLVSGGIDIKVLRLNAEFGFEVNAQVSSSKSKDLQITGKILPGTFGAFWRQTIQLERRAPLVGHGSCGSTQDLGEVIVTDWVWSPDLATNLKCPPLPPSNLSPGQVFTPEG